jgi:hypothetical protein
MDNIVNFPVKNHKPKTKVRYHYSWFGYNYFMDGMHPQQNTHIAGQTDVQI